MSNEQSNYELGFQLKLENMAAEPAFDDLLEVAIETCLTDRSLYENALLELTDKANINSSVRLVEKLGVWGLRAQLDVCKLAYSFYNETDDDLPPPLMLDVLQDPSIVPLSPHPQVRNKIEAFGQALLSEAFNCLGTDAPQKVAEFQNATTLEQQDQVLLWLYDRISIIREVNKTDEFIVRTVPFDGTDMVIAPNPIIVELEETVKRESEAYGSSVEQPPELTAQQQIAAEIAEDTQIYHPMRLSPKLIGAYPDTKVDPSCLGVSLLAAAFFEKTGTDYLHAGVMCTPVESTHLTMLRMVDIVLNVAENIGLSSAADEKLNNLIDNIQMLRRWNRGHHAMVAAKQVDGSWVQFDPSYHTLHGSMLEAESYNTLYDNLTSIRSVDQGANVLFLSNEGSYSDVYLFGAGRLADKEVTIEQTSEIADRLMMDDDPVDQLKTYLLAKLIESDSGVMEMLVDVQARLMTGNKEKYIDDMFNEVIEDCVLDGMPIEAVQARYSTDPAFRARRIEDLHMAPYYVLLSMIGDAEDLLVRAIKSPASVIEAGLPAFRLGACVLSDFSLHCAPDEIPLSFFVANWSSHIAFEDHIPSRNDDSYQAELARRMSSIVRSGMLRYYHGYGIIHSFLEQGENTIGNSGE